MSSILYSEQFRPWFLPLTFFLPLFWHYGVQIDEESITFGYGMLAGPAKGGLCSHTAFLKDIDQSNIITGYASGKDNLLQFGGWGIRRSLRSKTWVYNASFRGPYVEFTEKQDKVTKYRFVTSEPSSFLAGENNQLMKGKTKGTSK